MIDKPQIVQTAPVMAAVIRFTIPRAEIRNVMGPGHAELAAVIAAQGGAAAGPWFSHHFKMDPGIFDFEIGIPVSSAIVASGRVKAGQLPAAKVVRTIYHGDYEELGAGWGEFMAWIEAEKLATRPDLWEIYVAGPESNPDPATFRTELNKPLIS